MKSINWIVLLLLTFISSTPILSQSLELNFLLDKEVYLYGEPVVGIVSLNNNGNDISVPTFGFMFEYSGLNAKLVNQDDQVLKKRQDISILYDLNTNYLLKNGESICDFLDITNKFGNDDDKFSSSELSLTRRVLPLGRYSLLITYKDPKDNNNILRKTIRFSVVQPSNENDINFSNKLSSTFEEFKSTKNSLHYYSGLKEIIDNNSKSDYKILAYLRIIFELSMKDSKAEGLVYLEKMFKEFPNKVTTYMISSLFWDSNKDFFHKPEIQKAIKSSNLFNYLKYYLNSYELILE